MQKNRQLHPKQRAPQPPALVCSPASHGQTGNFVALSGGGHTRALSPSQGLGSGGGPGGMTPPSIALFWLLELRCAPRRAPRRSGAAAVQPLPAIPDAALKAGIYGWF